MDWLKWYFGISIAFIFWLLSMFESERNQRKRLETIVAKLRAKQTLNEQEIEIYLEAKKYDWLSGRKLPA